MEKHTHPIRAVIFDMDGTLIDTERIGAASWDHAGRDLGIHVPDPLKRNMVGRTLPDIQSLVRDALPHADTDQLLGRANHHYHRLVTETTPPIKAGALALLDWLRERKIPMAIATSSRAFQAEDKLGRTGLRDYFSVVVAGDQVARGKPDPEIFQTAAQHLGFPARECVVFEDSGPGIEAAERAGTFAVLVPEHPPADPAQACFASAVLNSLEAAPALLAPFFTIATPSDRA